MINLNDKLAKQYLVECSEHLATVETELLAIEKGGGEIDEEQVNRAFRAVHSVKGGAAFLDLVKIGELAHRMEDALALVHSWKVAPTTEGVDVLLRATDRLRELIQNPGESDRADISKSMDALAGLHEDQRASSAQGCASPAGQADQDGRRLRVLLVEDDFVSRLVLQTFLSRYGECHIAVNGREAVDAFRFALTQGQRYDLICMDIMMPEMDGREAVRQVRALELAHGILSMHGAKIIMTTAVCDIEAVSECYQDLCDAYLTKPIDLAKLLSQMKACQLVR